ncbi:hypothetical protein EWM64_g5829 [Hericium alpestre]|uniref:AMP-dependent synthetase/ligase domain-containing protein n=1 Tax=Hericium alpestre TaxID=135208 RepID=A0A4Y9ZVV0_9AGAM|nr:hypothetical protein EWM64_g5829 [Hericium alpestre]
MPFELEKTLVDGRLQTVYKHAEPNLRTYFLKFTTLYAQRECIVYEQERYTYAQVRARAEDISDALWERYGVRKGDRVAIITRNLPESIITFWALCLLGAIPAFVNTWQARDGLEHCIALVSPKLLILDTERTAILSPHLPAFLAAHPSVHFTGVIAIGPTEGVQTGRSHTSIISWTTAFPPRAAPPAQARRLYESEPATHPDDPAPSSSRLARLHAREPLLRAGQPLPAPGTTPAGAFLMTAPLFHVVGVTTNVMVNMFRGNKLVLMRKWDTDEAARLCVAESITDTSGSPALLLDMARTASFAGVRRTLRGATSGAAPLPPRLRAEFGRAFPGAALVHVYGLTETSAIATGVVGPDFDARPTTAGLPAPVTEIRIVDPETLAVLPVQAVGEMWIRGANVMRCYWGDPDATRKAMTREGWFRTGDLGSLDEDGFLYIKDRLKDIIVRGGENIPSTLIEDALYHDPRVHEAAAVAVPDGRLGELPAALVVVEQGLTEAQLLHDVQQRYGSLFEIGSNALERNAAGKLDKMKLREIAKAEWARRMGRKVLGNL